MIVYPERIFFWFSDTPWDEPSKRSPEYQRYLSGRCFNEEPWSRLGTSLLCTCFRLKIPRYNTHIAPRLILIALLTGMLAVDPEQRTTLPEVFEHSWITRYTQAFWFSQMDLSSNRLTSGFLGRVNSLGEAWRCSRANLRDSFGMRVTLI